MLQKELHACRVELQDRERACSVPYPVPAAALGPIATALGLESVYT